MTQILKKRKTANRTTCPECSQGIRKGQLYTMVDERAVHIFCAADAGNVETCPECFLIGGQCACNE